MFIPILPWILSALKGLAWGIAGSIVEKYATYRLKKKTGVDINDPDQVEKMIAELKQKLESIFSIENLKNLTGSIAEKINTLISQILNTIRELMPDISDQELNEIKKEISKRVNSSIIKKILEWVSQKKPGCISFHGEAQSKDFALLLLSNYLLVKNDN